MTPIKDTAAVLFDARLVPHRSLSVSNFHLLLLIYIVVSCALSLPFVLMGAWPVAGFLGLDGILLYWAFRANYRSARAYETISMTFVKLQITQVTAGGSRHEWLFHPWWTRLAREDDEEFGLRKLMFHSRGNSVEIAAFLSPIEKEEFARELSGAMAQARQGPRYS